ncbi:MAG: ribonuclease HII [Deltaproteobacteria bacterium]|nr:MAG: ribonuclease HII [Deltaproteobacteria bacterium]
MVRPPGSRRSESVKRGAAPGSKKRPLADQTVDDPEVWWRAQGLVRLVGVDEVGRGPLAGPVVAAAVILPPQVELDGLTDSKRLSPDRRELFDHQIRRQALAYAIQAVAVFEIDRQGIMAASLQAMAQAVQALPGEPEMVLVDGPWRLPLDYPQQSVVRGDARCLSIAAASVLAKVYRDRQMIVYHRRYPQYNFARHKGYGTAEHREAIRRWGPCALHRRTFRGVREWLREDDDL